MERSLLLEGDLRSEKNFRELQQDLERILAIVEKWPTKPSLKDLISLLRKHQGQVPESKSDIISWLNQIWKRITSNKVSRRLGVITFEDRLNKAIEDLQEDALEYEKELEERSKLRSWLENLPLEASLELDFGNGDQELNEWSLIAKQDDKVIGEFSLGRLFYILEEDDNLPVITEESRLQSLRERIPLEVLRQWKERKEFLERMGFTSEKDVREILAKFDRVEIPLDLLKKALGDIKICSKLPPEIEYLYLLSQKNSEVYALLNSLIGILEKDPQRRLTIKTLKEQPEDLVEGIRYFSAITQHGLTQWLESYIKNGERPQLNQSDYALREERLKIAYSSSFEETLRRMLTSNDKDSIPEENVEYYKRILQELFLELLIKENDWEGLLDRVKNYTKFFVSVEVHGGQALSAEEVSVVQKINQLLDEQVAPEIMSLTFSIHDMREISKEAMTILKLLPFIGFAVHELEGRGLGPFAKFLASQSGDTLTETAEVMTYLKQYGFTSFADFFKTLISKGDDERKKEALKLCQRLKITAPALMVSAVLSGMSHEMIKRFGPRIGGFFFAFSAVLGTLVTQIVTIGFFANAYKDLSKEGKLPGMRPEGLHDYEWEQLFQFIGGEKVIKEIMQYISEFPHMALQAMREGLIRFFNDPRNIWQFFMFTFDDAEQAGLVFRDLGLMESEGVILDLDQIKKVILYCFSLKGFISQEESLSEEDIKSLLEKGFGKELTEEQVDKFLNAINETIDDLKIILDHIKEYLDSLSQETREKIFNPSSLEKFKVAFGEAIWRNSARRSIALAILASLVVVPFGAYLALKEPFLWAVFGDFEAFSAGFLSFIFSRKGNTEKILRKLLRRKSLEKNK